MEAPGDVETADQVDIEWTDYEKRRYNKYKAHDGPTPALRGPVGPCGALRLRFQDLPEWVHCGHLDII